MWDFATTVKLIKLYESCPELWDNRHPDHTHRAKKKESINKIAKELNTTTQEVNRKLNSLMAQYRRERNIFKNLSESGATDIKTPWWAYQYFGFLQKKTEATNNEDKNKEVAMSQVC